MLISTRSAYGATLATLLTLGTSACLDQDNSSLVAPEFGVVQENPGQPSAFEVYTQNAFLGGDTGPLFSLDLTDPGNIGAVIGATHGFYMQVMGSNIPERAAAFVDEIDARRPDVVALQEATGYATGYLDGSFNFTPTAAGPDLLASVMAEIAARGLPYSIGEMLPTTRIALPMGPPDASGLPALGVQDRVVMLVRDDIGAYESASGIYDHRLDLGPAAIVRGWVRIQVDRDGTPYNFVATHLETQGPFEGHPIRVVHNGQATELQGMLDELHGVAVLMGDLNSDAAAEPDAPSYTQTYEHLVGAGFTDVWATAPHRSSDSGVTCCQQDAPTVRLPSERIDFVLVRSDEVQLDNGSHRGYFRAEVIGSHENDRTASGNWPSDHAGLIASIRLPN